MVSLFNKSSIKILIVFSPIFINFFVNIIGDEKFLKIINFNFYNLTLVILLFVFLFLIGNSIKKVTKLKTISISIVTYLFSFFILENILLLITPDLLIFQVFLINNIIWFVYLVLISKEYYYSFSSLLTYFVLNFVSNNFLDSLEKNKNLIGDVYDFHFPHVKNIYEKGFYYSMNNSVLEGYPQFLNYIQALLNTIVIKLDTYIYLSPSTNVLYFLTLLLFLELDLSKNNKILIIAIFTIFTFNSEWIRFLFLDSLMVEGLLSYLFATIINAVNQSTKLRSKYGYLIFVLFGMLYLTKQFVSIITLILLLFFLFKKSYRKFVAFGLSGLVINEISYLTFFKDLTKNYHFKQIDVADTIMDIFLIRDLKFENIGIILKNLFIDKPFTYLLIIFFLFLFLQPYKLYVSNFALSSYVVSILANFILIFLLYVSVWQNMELESPIRYMLNFFHITLISTFIMGESLNSDK